MRKKTLLLCCTAAVLLLALVYGVLTTPFRLTRPESPARFRTQGKTIQHLENGNWVPFEIVGVNMGTGYPGLFPNEDGISQKTYYRWFCQIAEMNANTLRVYKLQSPAFYAALDDYNRSHNQKLYLIQGADFPEPLMYSQDNLLDPAVHADLFRDTELMVNALHGDAVQLVDNSLFCYTHDVSDYVLGYILGLEWDELFVEYVCRLNQDVSGFEGTYFRCPPQANAFEVFLAQWGEHLAAWETDRYGDQPLVSFCNWPNTDPFRNELPILTHRDEPLPQSETTVDVDLIRPTQALRSGMFASYNVYPYFPAFLQHGPYTQFVDETGRRNPYMGYLKALADHHTCPVIITEYGIPASRSQAYGEIWKGFPHGGLTEKAQGEAMADLFHDIRASGCAGSIAFTWQDEWYKTIWNEKLISDSDRRAFWSNAMCAEQFFGVLAFEPGDGRVLRYPDSDLSEWQKKHVITQADGLTLSMQSDEKYLYLLAQGLDSLAPDAAVNIALDVIPAQGCADLSPRTYARPVDFILRIDRAGGKSGFYVNRDSDLLAYSALGGYHDTTLGSMESLLEQYARTPEVSLDGEQFFVAARADGDINSHLAARWLINQVGWLTPGNTNPAAPDYASNGDYCFGPDSVEIRIPWQLMNFSDPSSRLIAYPREGLLVTETIDRIYAAPYLDGTEQVADFGSFKLKSWKAPKFHERLKDSYYILQTAFGEVLR